MTNHWRALYKIVAESNTVIARIPSSEMSASDKLLFEARGRFFRAFAYRALSYIWGGVPLELNRSDRSQDRLCEGYP